MPVKHKGLMIILDGLGDRPCRALDGLTPLEAADTPNMNHLASQGLLGLMDPLKPGIPVGTHTGTGVLFGLPSQVAAKQPRGPIEAAGIHMEAKPGDILLRCNFSTLEPKKDGFDIIDRRAGRISEDTGLLAEQLQNIDLGEGIMASLQVATSHRAVLCLSGEGLTDQISDTDPYHDFDTLGVLDCKPINEDDEAATRTAAAVNRFIREAYSRLADHPVNLDRIEKGLPPANGIITRGAGTHTQLPSLPHHAELKTAVVAAEKTILGLAALMDYELITDDSFTASASTNLEGKVRAAQSALEEFDLVFLHIKGTDICSHDFDPNSKKELIESIDAAIKPLLDSGYVISITGDHTTDSNTGNHTADPVPSVLASPTGRADKYAVFDESNCMSGGLGRISGEGLIASILDAMGALGNYKPSDSMYFSF